MFRLQDNVPSYYIEKSRDFQLFLRLYDFVNNSTRFSIESIETILDPDRCNDRLLTLLCTRVGFFPRNQYNTKALRAVLSCFSKAMKYKGSIKGISIIVAAILKSEENYDDFEVILDKTKYIAGIYTQHPIKNELLLQDVLNYILPVGFILELNLFTQNNEGNENLGVEDEFKHAIVYTSETSVVKPLKATLGKDNNYVSGDRKIADRAIGNINTNSTLSIEEINNE